MHEAAQLLAEQGDIERGNEGTVAYQRKKMGTYITEQKVTAQEMINTINSFGKTQETL